MAIHNLGDDRGLYYELTPAKDGFQTFVFVNALTGSTEQWEVRIAPALREFGYGTLTYNFRGQNESPFAPDDPLDEAGIIADLQSLMREYAPDNSVLVGLSIGGLFAAKAHLSGTPAQGLVLINTLRKPGLTLDWTNEAIYRAARLGGTQLVMDMFLPMLTGPEKLEEFRANCLGEGAYEPFPPESGLLKLMAQSRNVDWNVPYEDLKGPVLIMTGLRDRIFLDRDAVRALIDRLKEPYHVELPEAGHLIPTEDPDAVVEVLNKFAEDLRAP